MNIDITFTEPDRHDWRTLSVSVNGRVDSRWSGGFDDAEGDEKHLGYLVFDGKRMLSGGETIWGVGLDDLCVQVAAEVRRILTSPVEG